MLDLTAKTHKHRSIPSLLLIARLDCPTSVPVGVALRRLLGFAIATLLFLPAFSGLAATAKAGDLEFTRDVAPVLTKAGCNGGKCHGSFQGRGGLQLSLLGFNPAVDYEALVLEARGRRVTPSSPDQSLFLRKARLDVPHGGGKRLEVGSPGYEIFRAWINAGLPGPSENDPHVAKLEITPPEATLAAKEDVDLKVVAHWSDGQQRDVTRWALYESRDELIAEVTSEGHLQALKPGRTSVTVTYMGQVNAVTVTVPYAQIDDFPEFAGHNFIDELVAAEWKKVGVLPAELSSDYEFVRRLYLDLIGTLPKPEEIQAFVASTDPDKRSKLIDELLQRPEYVDYFTLRWGDLLRVHRRYVGDKGLWTFYGWLRKAVRENTPLDQLTRELLTAQGNLYTNGPVAFFYVDSKPEEFAETTAQIFLGVRLQCARCHHHPYEVWSQEDYYGLANFFTRIEVKDNGDGGRYGGAKLLRPVKNESRNMRPKMRLAPTALGHEVDPEQTNDVRRELADWITSKDNPFFAKNFANRLWAHLMGRGLVHPVDDLRATNPPSHPDLMDALAAEFVRCGYDAKHILRLICNSRVYQLASEVAPPRDQGGAFYTHRVFRRMPAAVLLDAVNQATGTQESFQGLPPGTRAIELPDPAVQSYFLDAFGRSVRANPCECAQSTDPDLAQALHFINSSSVNDKITAKGGRVAQLLKEGKSNPQVIDNLYLATFGRPAHRRRNRHGPGVHHHSQVPRRSTAGPALVTIKFC